MLPRKQPIMHYLYLGLINSILIFGSSSMNIHIYSTLFILFTQSFSCIGSDQHIQKPYPKIQEKELTFDDVPNYFASPRKKYQLPEQDRQALIDFCIKKKPALIKLIKEDKQHNADMKILSQEVPTLPKESKIIKGYHELHEIEKGNTRLEKKITAIKTQKKKIIQNNAQKTNDNTHNNPEKKNVESDTDAPLTVNEKRRCWKLLQKHYSLKEQKSILLKIKDDADDAYTDNSKDFNMTHHLWRDKINHKYKFAFWTCGNKIEFYHEKDPMLLPEGFGCNEKCPYYRQKIDISKNDTSSDTSSSSYESNSKSTDSESQEECKDAFFTKEEMEAMAN